MPSYEELVATIRDKRAYYETIIRDALREAIQDDPSLLTDSWGKVSTLEQFIETHLYDLEGLPLDDDPGIKWSYGQLYAADELLREIETDNTAPVPSPLTATGMQRLCQANGYACPHCGTQDVTECTTRTMDGTRYQEMRCDRCDLHWTNVWAFDRLLLFPQGNDLATDPLVVPIAERYQEGATT